MKRILGIIGISLVMIADMIAIMLRIPDLFDRIWVNLGIWAYSVLLLFWAYLVHEQVKEDSKKPDRWIWIYGIRPGEFSVLFPNNQFIANVTPASLNRIYHLSGKYSKRASVDLRGKQSWVHMYFAPRGELK